MSAGGGALGGRLLVRLRLPAVAGSLKSIRDTLRGTLTDQGADAEWTHDMVLAVDEACQNVIRHAYGDRHTTGDIVVEVVRCTDRDGAPVIVVRLTDFAAPVDPDRIRPRALDDVRPGGLGVHFIRALTDDCGWEPPPDGAGNAFRLVKRL